MIWMFNKEHLEIHYFYLLQELYKWMMLKHTNSHKVSKFYQMDQEVYTSIMISSD